jgi:hypothetical protein
MSPTIDSFAEMSQRAFSRQSWSVKLSLDDGSTIQVHRIADHDVELREALADASREQYVGLLGGIGTIEYGLGAISKDNYVEATVQITILHGHLLDQEPHHTIFDALNSALLNNAAVIIQQTYQPLRAGVSAEIETIFSGNVYRVTAMDKEKIVLMARADRTADERVTVQITEGQYPDANPGEIKKNIPAIGGRIEAGQRNFWLNRDTSKFTDLGWSYLCQAWKGSPARMIDKTTRTIRVSSGPIATAEPDARMRVAAFWPDDPDLPVVVGNVGASDYTAADGTITLPTPIGGASGSILLERFMPPIPDARQMGSFINPGVSPEWEKWWNAFDNRNPETFLLNEGHTSTGLLTFKNNFIKPPVGADLTNIWPGDNYMVTMVYHEKISGGGASPGFELKFVDDVAPFTQTFTHTGLADGAYTTFLDLLDTNSESAIATGWPDGSPSSRIAMFLDNTNTRLRVYMWGLRLTFEVDTDAAELGKNRIDDAVFVFFGQAPTSPVDAGSVLDGLSAAVANSGLTLADFDLTTNHGGFIALNSALDASVQSTSGDGTAEFVSSILETGQVSASSVFSKAMRDYFIHIWRDPATSKYKAVIKNAGLSTSTPPTTFPEQLTLVMQPWEIEQNTIKLQPQSVDEIVNAVYVNFDKEHTGGVFREQVYIDNSTQKSRKFDGTRDISAESNADDSQALFGRREMIINAEYIEDAKTAWDCCVRRFNVQRVQRLEMTIEVLDLFRFLEPGMVFETTAHWDRIFRFPGFVSAGSESEPSWDGRAWFVERIRRRPYRPMVIKAINID